MIDDLGFDADYGSLDPLAPQLITACNAAPPCAHCTAEAKRTARAVELWDELTRQREAQMTDERTTRLVKMLNIANRLTELNVDVTNLVLHDDKESLRHLQRLMGDAARLATDIYEEISNG